MTQVSFREARFVTGAFFDWFVKALDRIDGSVTGIELPSR